MNLRLVFLPGGGEPAFALTARGGAIERARLDPDPASPPAAMRTVLAAPGPDLLIRWLALPTKVEAQARAAAAYLLEDELASARDQAHVALGPEEPAGRLVCVVDRGRLRDWLAEAARYGLTPDAVVPEPLLLPAPEGEAGLAVEIAGRLAARGPGYALGVEADLAAIVLADRPVRRIADPAEVEALLLRGAESARVSLLQGAFAPRGSPSAGAPGWRAAAIAGAALLFAPVALAATDLVRLESAARAAERAAEAAAVAAAPDVVSAEDPVGAALARIARANAGSGQGFLGPAAALFAAMEQTASARIVSLTFVEGEALRASIAFTDYQDIERLRAAAQRLGHLVEEGGATSDASGARTEILVRPAS